MNALIEKRARAWESAKEILDRADDRGTLGAEDRAAYDAAIAHLDTVDADIRGWDEREKRGALADELRSAAENRGVPLTARGARVPDADIEAARKFASGETRAVEFGMAETRANELFVGTAGSSTGGQTVPNTFVNRLIEYMTLNSGVLSVSPTILRTDSGETLTMPRVTAVTSAASLVAEAGALANARPAFDQVTLSAYKYGFLRQLSSELVSDTAINLMEFLARDGGRALGEGLGAHLLTGTGTAQPQGVLTASTLGKTGPTGVTGGFGSQSTAGQGGDVILDLIHSVIEPYRRNGKFLTNDSTVLVLRKIKNADGIYAWAPGLTADAPSTLFGYPVFTDPNMPAVALGAKSLLFGDFSPYTVRLVGPVRYERSDEYAFANDLITYRTLMRADAKLLDTTGCVKHFIGGAS